jgi:hypothetical protein
VFNEAVLARLQYDEPITACDRASGIGLYYRFDHAVGGRLSLAGGILADDVLSLGCEPGDINRVATVLLDGLKAQMG